MAPNEDSSSAFVAGLLVGGVVGAALALIFAPQSGSDTRAQIHLRGDGGTLPRPGGGGYFGDELPPSEPYEPPRIVLDEGNSTIDPEPPANET